MSKYFPDIAGLFLLITYLVFLLLISDVFVADGDTFWHIKAGNVMLENHALLTHDIFSHTAINTPWTAHEWLSEIIMAGVHRLAGLEGVIVLFILLVSMTFWLLFRICEQIAGEKIALLCVSLALLFSGSHLTARPHLFTWLFLVLSLALLVSRSKWIYWLPLIMLCWANMHGGFVLGLLLQGIFIIGFFLCKRLEEHCATGTILHQLKHPVIVLILSLVAVGINPFGYKLLLFPFHVTSNVFSANISEWLAPDFQQFWYFRYFLVLLILLLSFRSIGISWKDRLLLLFFLNAALTHSRNISLLLIVMAPGFAKLLQERLAIFQKRTISAHEPMQLSSKTGPAGVLALSFLLLLAGTIQPGALTFLRPEKVFNVKTSELHQLAAYLKEHRPQGNLFNNYSLGGYLLYELEHAPRVFIDGRADMYGEKIFKDYKQIVFNASQREALLEKYRINWIVFDKNSNLVYSLIQTKRWTLEYDREPYAVLTRKPIGL